MGARVSFFGIFVLFIGGVVILGVILAMILILRGKRKAVRVPSCGACGYAVAGLDALRCPECGADLREVGIATPGNTSSPFLRVFAYGTIWTIVMIGIAIGVSIGCRLAFPFHVRSTNVVQLTPSQTNDFLLAQVTYDGLRPMAGAGANRGYDTALIQIQDATRGLMPGFEVDLVASPLRGRRVGMPNWGSFDGPGLKPWVDAEMTAVPPERRGVYAATLQTQITNFLKTGGTATTGGVFRGVSTSSTQNVLPNNAQRYGSVGCIVVWLIGLAWLVRRVVRGPADAKPAA